MFIRHDSAKTNASTIASSWECGIAIALNFSNIFIDNKSIQLDVSKACAYQQSAKVSARIAASFQPGASRYKKSTIGDVDYG